MCLQPNTLLHACECQNSDWAVSVDVWLLFSRNLQSKLDCRIIFKNYLNLTLNFFLFSYVSFASVWHWQIIKQGTKAKYVVCLVNVKLCLKIRKCSPQPKNDETIQGKIKLVKVFLLLLYFATKQTNERENTQKNRWIAELLNNLLITQLRYFLLFFLWSHSAELKKIRQLEIAIAKNKNKIKNKSTYNKRRILFHFADAQNFMVQNVAF